MTAVLDPMRMSLAGRHLIEASAGTGKTYTIATLFVRLVVERGLGVDQILVVTFTEAAAAELRDRVRTRLREVAAVLDGTNEADDTMAAWFEERAKHRDEDAARVRRALQAFDEAAISTIHGFCHRVLHDSAFETEVSFETELVVNQQPLLDEAVRDYWAQQVHDADGRFAAHALTQLAPTRMLSLAWLAASNPGVELIPPPPHDDDELDPDEAAFASAYRDARAQWRAHREEIATLLLEHKGLSRSLYRTKSIPSWFTEADGFFHEPTAGERLNFKGLAKMGTASLVAGCKKTWTKKGGTAPEHPFFDAAQRLEDAAVVLREDIQRRSIEFKRGLVRYIDTELPRRKQMAGVQSFDDLLHRLDRAVTKPQTGPALSAAIRQVYRAALIDEFQDTDPVQYRIFDEIFGHERHPLLLIGDPKQAIYGFRGADVFAYLRAGRSVPQGHRHTMTTNWRSDPALLQAVEHLFDVPLPFKLDGIGFVPVEPRPGAQDALRIDGQPVSPLAIKVQQREHGIPLNAKKAYTIMADWVKTELPRRIAADIATLLTSGATLGDRAVQAGDIAVLSRTNAQAQQVQAALRALGIPGVVYGDASVYETSEARDLQRVLAASAEPATRSLLRAALTTELLGVTGGQLEAMADDDEAWETWAQRFRRWNALWVQHGFIRMLRTLLADLELGERLLRLDGGERRMTNLLHLTELLHEAASREHLGPAGLLHWFDEQRGGDQRMSSEAVKLRLERDDEAVQLITVHRSKGLEYPIVYCPYLWSPDELRASEIEHLKFHDPEHDDALRVDISVKPTAKEQTARRNHPTIKRATFEASAESLRLLYVALTRARHRCVLVWGPFDRFHYSPLGYLLHANRAELRDGLPNVPDLLRNANDIELWELLQARKHPSWDVSVLESVDVDPLPNPHAAGPVALSSRVARSSIDRLFRTTSFTSIAEHHGDTDLTGGRDVDDASRRGTTVSVRETASVRLHNFPRGAEVGNFFHDVLEHLDFQADPDTTQEHVSEGLRAHGLLAPGLVESASTAIDDVLHSPLDDDGLRLCDVPAQDRIAELGFTLPIAAALTEADGASVAFDRSSLRRAMSVQGEDLPSGYLDQLSALQFVPVRGYLRGFIDLIYRVEGRWYVVDYKTNDLGPSPDDYTPAKMAASMASAHYVLQYHLYTAALCRHLSLRTADFDYERDFGGIRYLYLRGMHPDRSPERGVYIDRPPLARIEALDALLQGDTGGSQ